MNAGRAIRGENIFFQINTYQTSKKAQHTIFKIFVSYVDTRTKLVCIYIVIERRNQ